jgi:hypothetical protein
MNKPSKTLRNVLYVMLLVATGLEPAPATEPPDRTPAGRRVIILRDVTTSFVSFSDEAEREILRIVAALGPGDELLVLDIGPDFDPARNVVVQCIMPKPPADFRLTASNLAEFRRRQAELAEVWAIVEKNRRQLIDFFRTRPALRRGGTNLALPLEYAAKRLQDQSDGKLPVVRIFSDLHTESSGVNSRRPPKTQGSFAGADVQVFLAPWDAARQQLEPAWRTWFIDTKEARSFRMFDTAESQTIAPLKPSSFPRNLPSPFQQAGK